MFEVKSTSGKLLFSADEQEVVVGAERLRVMGEWPFISFIESVSSALFVSRCWLIGTVCESGRSQRLKRRSTDRAAIFNVLVSEQ